MAVAIAIALAQDTRSIRNTGEAGSIGLLMGFIGVAASVGVALRIHAVEYATVRGILLLFTMVGLSIFLHVFRQRGSSHTGATSAD